MATATSTPAPVLVPAGAATVIGDQRVVFQGLGWDGYQALLKLQGEKSRPRMLYLDGDVLLMSPSHFHERLNDHLGLFIGIVVMELNIPCESTRQTTFSLHDGEAGVQPDDSYYFANYRIIATKDFKEEIDLRVDPPPDLVIEVVHTHSAKHALEVLRRLGVPEVWVCKRDGLSIMVLTAEGQYAESRSSLCLPFLTATEIFDWVTRPNMSSRTEWSIEVQRWARETLIPRRQALQG